MANQGSGPLLGNRKLPVGAKYTGFPWERWEDEPPKAFGYFMRYRDMGSRRTIKALAEEVSCTEWNLRVIAGEWGWGFRSDQWDAYLSQYAADVTKKKVKEHAERQFAVADKLLQAAEKAVVKLLQAMDNEYFKATVRSTTVIVTEAVKLHRLLAGESTDLQEGRTSGAKFKPDEDRIRSVLEILRGVGAVPSSAVSEGADKGS